LARWRGQGRASRRDAGTLRGRRDPDAAPQRYLFTRTRSVPAPAADRRGVGAYRWAAAVKPILTVELGETQQFAKVRTQSRALAEMTRKLSEDVAAFGPGHRAHIADRELAERYAREQIEPIAGAPVRVIPVSPVVGLHVGPAVAIVYETQRDWASQAS
jgi:hypothetical protein